MEVTRAGDEGHSSKLQAPSHRVFLSYVDIARQAISPHHCVALCSSRQAPIWSCDCHFTCSLCRQVVGRLRLRVARQALGVREGFPVDWFRRVGGRRVIIFERPAIFVKRRDDTLERTPLSICECVVALETTRATQERGAARVRVRRDARFAERSCPSFRLLGVLP